MKPKNQMAIDIVGCARRGKDHRRLVFKRLANPQDTFDFWAMCPTTRQPVLLRIEPDEGAAVAQ